MNVKELKKELEYYDDDTEVMFEYPSGDYWRHTLAGEIQQSGERYVEHSEYHNKDIVVDYISPFGNRGGLGTYFGFTYKLQS